MNTAKIIHLKPKKNKCVNVDGVKYFTEKEIKMLRKAARKDHEVALQRNQVTGVRAWMVIDLLTCTGLRVSEVANLRIKDLHIGHGRSEIFVCGKNNVCGSVQIPLGLKKHLKAFINWKSNRGEGIQPEDFLFVGQRGVWTSQGIQQTIKKYLKQLNLYEPGKSVHALRHSYAVELYQRERCLRTVQKQLRHRSIQSTQIYADVTKSEIQEQIRGLWN